MATNEQRLTRVLAELGDILQIEIKDYDNPNDQQLAAGLIWRGAMLAKAAKDGAE